jgi:hypothetical protein
MSVVGGARNPSPLAARSVLDRTVVNGGEATSPTTCGKTAKVDGADGANRAAKSSPDCQRRTIHADRSVSAMIDHAQLKRHVPSKQRTPSIAGARLAKAGKKTTFISKPPRLVLLGRTLPRDLRSKQPDEHQPSA